MSGRYVAGVVTVPFLLFLVWDVCVLAESGFVHEAMTHYGFVDQYQEAPSDRWEIQIEDAETHPSEWVRSTDWNYRAPIVPVTPEGEHYIQYVMFVERDDCFFLTLWWVQNPQASPRAVFRASDRLAITGRPVTITTFE